MTTFIENFFGGASLSPVGHPAAEDQDSFSERPRQTMHDRAGPTPEQRAGGLGRKERGTKNA
jgi:hypothetical protein